jgi:hypothetical protein
LNSVKARFLREAIEADRYPLSPRVRRLHWTDGKEDDTFSQFRILFLRIY